MRKLKTSDIPSFCRCLKKLGVREQFRAIAAEANTAKEVWDRGFDLVWGIFDAATEAPGENALYDFLAGPFETTSKGVADMDLGDLLAGIQELLNDENLMVFFKFAAASMK